MEISIRDRKSGQWFTFGDPSDIKIKMTEEDSKCLANTTGFHNETYVCDLPKGHQGAHKSTTAWTG